ncbi:MAG: hypothetical protein UX91_C0004G0026 [Candidatus Amesbacteria bacterium GW2011_GWB1_47_19]|nr:MAG: hypothetical protein UW51_C0005G0026 [Candidatus Amesbacteria bacterium GW2011_GWA1_44_24]KKU31583.1 MAG: hypothetical protein UX46_C0004G0026 [Candidatus Amesbacteria bacterium GW2011_GWC1_46_24]KKU67356.1 MAG: hypothetical protein UX91_C0004G0026 [Candidatus Amesbacteria bacterium GW2011_GWB1_47_19]
MIKGERVLVHLRLFHRKKQPVLQEGGGDEDNWNAGVWRAVVVRMSTEF